MTFTRTTAALNAYVNGFITWTGSKGHVVEQVVVIQPVKFAAPVEVTASGASGSLNLNAKSGYTGNLAYSIRGLQAATKFVTHVGGDPSVQLQHGEPGRDSRGRLRDRVDVHDAGRANYLRFQTFASDAGAAAHDLDMFVYRAAPGSSSLRRSSRRAAGPTRTRSSNTHERRQPRRRCAVQGVRARLLGRCRRCRRHALRVGAHRPRRATRSSAVPAAQAVTIGQVVPGTLSWTGLPAGNRYLGRVHLRRSGRRGRMAATTVAVSTR